MAEKSEFELITPEKLLINQTVNWEICYLCQKENDENLQFPHKKKGKTFLYMLFRYWMLKIINFDLLVIS